jgi:hypothetical protein
MIEPDKGRRIAMGAWAEVERECVFEGQKAYVRSLARIENPYRPGTIRYIAWAEGWDAAYKADRS